MKYRCTVLLASFILSSCASLPSTVKSDIRFSTENISNLNDQRVVPIVVREIELPSAYKTNGKYAICNVSFTLENAVGYQSPKNIEVSSCNTNDETNTLKEKCKAHFSEWGFVLKTKYSPEDRYNAVCALKAKEL